MYIKTLIFLTFCCVCTVYCIRCWDCNSDNDPKCADPFDNSTVYMKDCDKEPKLDHYPEVPATMCRKTRQKVNGKWKYFRGCAYLGEPGIGGDERYCIMKKGTYNVFSEFCTCRAKDGCNSAISFHFNASLLVVTFILMVSHL